MTEFPRAAWLVFFLLQGFCLAQSRIECGSVPSRFVPPKVNYCALLPSSTTFTTISKPHHALYFLHGLGHALLFFANYKLVASLEVCDVMPEDWSRASCYGGVFMENVFNSTPETRDLSPTDFHYPCNQLDKKYRRPFWKTSVCSQSDPDLRPAAALVNRKLIRTATKSLPLMTSGFSSLAWVQICGPSM